jgi:hypothetical protein
MRKYGCRLSEDEVCRGYQYVIDDPVAQLLSRYFTVAAGERQIDHSLGEQEGEIDHLSRDAAIEYLQMPERVRALEGKFEARADVLEEKVEGISGQLEQLLCLFKPFIEYMNARGNGHSEVGSKDARGENDLSYVS